MTPGSTQDPGSDQPEDEYPDYLWPDDDEQPAGAQGPGGGYERGADRLVPFRWPAPPEPDPVQLAAERRRRLIGITLTAVVAAGLGGGAALVYRDARAATPAAAAAPTPSPGQGAGQTGPGQVTGLELEGQVTAVGGRSITIAAGPAPPVRAALTTATRFTGSVRTLAAVRVGDTVVARISVVNGAATVVSLQDPAS
jgi:hypothetical protein